MKKFEAELHHLNYVANKKRSELELEISKRYLDLLQSSHRKFDYIESPMEEIYSHQELMREMDRLVNDVLDAATSYDKAADIEFYKYLDCRDS